MDGCMRSARAAPTTPDTLGAAHLHPRVTSFRSRRSALTEPSRRRGTGSGRQLGTQARPGGQERSDRRLLRHRGAVVRAGQAPAPSSWRSGAEPERRRWRWPRPSPTSTWSPSRSTGAASRSCSAAIDREGVTNIRLVRGDGVDVLEHMFGPDSLTGVRVFFPDPWPKSRHHKRRLLQAGDRRADRRPACGPAVCCTRPPTTRATPSRSPRPATPSPCCAGSSRAS